MLCGLAVVADWDGFGDLGTPVRVAAEPVERCPLLEPSG